MKSIRKQLTRGLLGTTLGLLGLGLTALTVAACYAVIHEFDAGLRTKAFAISTLTVLTPEGVRVNFTDRFLRDFNASDPDDFFQIWTSDGTTLARSDSLGEKNLSMYARAGEKPKFYLLTLPSGQGGRAVSYTFKPKAPKGVEAPELLLVTASKRDDLDETLGLLIGLATATALLLTVATLWVVPGVLQRGHAPLVKLGEQAAQINADSLTARFPVDELPEELQPIAQRLNELLARLEQSFERERRFTADLAHELRTPLAELRSQAECAIKWPESRDISTDQDTLAITRQMESLVIHMLALSRGDQGQLSVKLEPVELDQMVRDVWRTFALRTEAHRLKVTIILKSITAIADPALLRSIIVNLCSNAVEYTPAGGEITLVTELIDNRVVLRITNTPGNLSSEDLPHLFERFWRKEAARSGGNHFGLGLSLAQTFSRTMNWTLGAVFDEQRRIAFTLTGPANPAWHEEIQRGMSADSGRTDTFTTG